MSLVLDPMCNQSLVVGVITLNIIYDISPFDLQTSDFLAIVRSFNILSTANNTTATK